MGEKNLPTILSYADTQMVSFSERKICDVDSLILSQFSYMHFNGIVGGLKDNKEPVAIKDIVKAELYSGLFDGVFNFEKCKELLLYLGASPRFRDIRMNFYEESTKVNFEQQFAAVTFFLPSKECYVAFRGTDTSMIGWKEDMNMSFLKEIPSQKSAKAYLDEIAQKTNCPIIIGGHSKGGNLAEYAAAMCDKEFWDRIKAVYSHDGPGFRKDVSSLREFQAIRDKVKKTLPEFSLVGMMLRDDNDYKVVKSEEKYLMQHDPFSWIIDGDDFVYLEGISKDAQVISKSVNEWLATIDDNNRQKFVDALYNVIEASNIEQFGDFTDEKKKSIIAVLDSAKEIDPDTKKFVFQTMSSLAGLYMKNCTSVFSWKPKNKSELIPK